MMSQAIISLNLYSKFQIPLRDALSDRILHSGSPTPFSHGLGSKAVLTRDDYLAGKLPSAPAHLMPIRQEMPSMSEFALASAITFEITNTMLACAPASPYFRYALIETVLSGEKYTARITKRPLPQTTSGDVPPVIGGADVPQRTCYCNRSARVEISR